jgi:hypothetical protein
VASSAASNGGVGIEWRRDGEREGRERRGRGGEATSGALLILVWAVIRGSWIENYDGTNSDPGASDPLQLARLRTALRIIREDPRLLVLGLTQTCPEGSVYLFVFLWVPALQEHSLLRLSSSGTSSPSCSA